MQFPLSPAALRRFVRAALHEDLGRGDVTTNACIDAGIRGIGEFVALAPGVLAGVPAALDVFRALDSGMRVARSAREGAAVRAGTTVLRIRGSLRALLTGERTALNILQHLSGVSTETRRVVDAVRGTAATILDTRKTTPLLRSLEKYAVRVGGGTNHRASLDEMILIKDNHIAAAGSVTDAVRRCRGRARGRLIEVEVDTLAQVAEAVACPGVGRIMLDNFSVPAVRAAVRIVRGQIPIEVSGGVTAATARAYARTGVAFISVGAITHSAPVLNVSFRIVTR